MALNSQQINQLLNEARDHGMDGDELAAFEELLVDRAANLSGAERLDMALALADEPELAAAQTFMQDMNANRVQAMKSGASDLNAMSADEWEGLTNGG